MALTGIIAFLNVVIRQGNTYLMQFIHFHYISQKVRAEMLSEFACYYINTALVVLISSA